MFLNISNPNNCELRAHKKTGFLWCRKYRGWGTSSLFRLNVELSATRRGRGLGMLGSTSEATLKHMLESRTHINTIYSFSRTPCQHFHI